MGTLTFGNKTPLLITMPQITSAAGELVAGRFNDASYYASTLWGIAQDLITKLGETDFPISWDPIDMTPIDPGGLDGVVPEEPPKPTIDPVTMDEVEFPYNPPDPVTTELPTRPEPVNNVPDPGIVIPDPPDVTIPQFTAEPPDITDADLPDAPTLSEVAVPQLSDITIPSPPEYNIPEFEWELPTDDLTPPDTQFSWDEAMYTSALKEALGDKLYNELATGGTGLDDATEQAIYDRAVSRQLDEEQDKLDQILNFFADRLYDFPPGALSNQMLEMNNKVLKTREDLNNDILIQQSKLAQTNTHFIISSIIAQEKNLMDYNSAYQARALDAAKFTVQGAILIYSAKVEAYKARLSVYAAQAEVYKARIAGEIGKAEFYKAEIEGISASVDVQKALVALYSAQVDANKIWIDLYNAEMQGAQIQAEIDKTKIMAFAALVQAYSAQVAAVTEQYKGYTAQISGEVAKADVFKAQIQAYATDVTAYKTLVDADVAALQAEIEKNRNAVEVYRANIQKYTAEIQRAVAEVDANVKIEGLEIDVYKALAANYNIELDALTKVYLGKVEEAKASASIEIQEADLIIREAVAKYDLVTRSITAAAQVASQMAAAAISGVSASANIQHGENRSDSSSYSVSQSDINQYVRSDVLQYQYIHTYEES